jgi:hypothetical protein
MSSSRHVGEVIGVEAAGVAIGGRNPVGRRIARLEAGDDAAGRPWATSAASSRLNQNEGREARDLGVGAPAGRR